MTFGCHCSLNSPNWNRPSYFAMKYLQHKGFRVIPVNPAAAGQTSATATTVSQGASEVAGFVEQTVARLDEMKSSIARTAENSQQMERTAESR